MQYFLVVIMVLLASCQSAPAQPTLGDQDMPSIRYLALGDSYTIGESVSEQERWPDQLARLLQAEGIHTEVTIIARTGWTTSELWEGIQARQIQPPYDLVSLLVGVNNQYRGYSIDEYREQFTFLLNKAIEYAGGKPERVIVLYIPDWGVTPFAADRDTERIAQEIDAFNSVNREESERAGVRYIDVTPISRMATDEASLIAEDGLHPAGKMYALWAEQVLPVARAILQ
ncbi:MAG: SGNH/GDSL hydrolase family protein [Chloroflexota bacterium]|nr:SGNH/GDSL hydrolase family protein [Chloroflexota bacterium]